MTDIDSTCGRPCRGADGYGWESITRIERTLGGQVDAIEHTCEMCGEKHWEVR
ncbi:hypothetical protein GS905_11855 [Rhodococcus hoagii]|uniref:Uncharacterized protein n=1 Tax=Rhodococcus hoagii TaxID=43767 RepID=A0A9Q4ZKH5_RHOHA|nr:hypothetical protein [Prescottella equi]MBM4489372.1 hypothetical protein [Prescottella equi]MBM4496231.1 hypothetical protein [Prescottella equi]MBM4516214.1 hypothetical protein [Prescottella equi]MBM4549458.1 hypothetical protein [Prescottella equi]MBM4567409.1 hypothetical protein [Prescottella equi]